MAKHTMISLTHDEIAKAKRISKEMFGKENVTGLFRAWLNQIESDKILIPKIDTSTYLK